MVHNGASYSAIGFADLHYLSTQFIPQWTEELESVPIDFFISALWPYGTGNLKIEPRQILGWVVLTEMSPDGTDLYIRHLVIDGSSNWVTGHNVTSRRNILQLDGNCMILCGLNGQRIVLLVIDADHHFYLPMKLFTTRESSSYSQAVIATAMAMLWSEVRPINDKVHKNVCGNSTFADMKVVLQRNGEWSDTASTYLRNDI